MREPKERAILDAATATFIRYGYRRTTMADIAEAAGMSRPALYLVFENKEAIFRGVVEMMMEDALEEIRAALPKHRSLRAKLSHIFEIWTIRPFELVSRAPDAAELLEQGHAFAADVYEKKQEQLVELLTAVLKEGRSSKKGRVGAEATARVMAAAVRGFKSAARDVDDLRALVADLVALAT